ncbi:hypothetical protein [Luteolibacter ambystomatis]|uniref:hypothetical protein n=1 Tax=Luteolibacter ambystomatis TaxID=2824561 RepID=UPI0036DF29C0
MTDRLPSWVLRIAGLLGLDKKVLTGLGARIMSMAAAPVGAFLTVWTLTPEKQGLYYLFASLLALRALFELGAGTSVIQVAAHARGDEEGRRTSPLEPAFVATVNRWMLRVATVYGLAAGLGGAAFLIYQGHGDFHTLGAWVSFITISSLQFASEGRWGLLEGADQVAAANILRTKNALIQYLVQWSLLLLGAGLFSFCAGALAAYLSQEIRFRKNYPWMYVPFRSQIEERLVHFKKELLRLIKRASQTYLTTYFVFQIQQPICFHLLGAPSSARLGFSQTMGSAMIGLPLVWLAMNFPKLAHLIADEDVAAARRLFKARWLQVCLFSMGCAAAAFVATKVLAQFPRFEGRLMDDNSMLILFGAQFVQTCALGLTYWPRAFKVEPFVIIAYVQMIATPLMLWGFLSTWGLRGGSLAILGTWIIGGIGIALTVRPYWKTGTMLANRQNQAPQPAE